MDRAWSRPWVAANEAGTVAGAWTRFVPSPDPQETVWTSREVGGWQSPVQVGWPEAFGPLVTVDGAGSSLVVFSEGEYETRSLVAAWRPVAEPYGSPEILASSAGLVLHWASTAFDGTSFVVWASDERVVGARRDPTGCWGAPRVIDAMDGDADRPENVVVSADDVGGATAVWTRQSGRLLHVFWSHYLDGRGWTDPVDAHAAMDWERAQPSVAAAPDGTALIAWTVTALATSQLWAMVVGPHRAPR